MGSARLYGTQVSSRLIQSTGLPSSAVFAVCFIHVHKMWALAGGAAADPPPACPPARNLAAGVGLRMSAPWGRRGWPPDRLLAKIRARAGAKKWSPKRAKKWSRGRGPLSNFYKGTIFWPKIARFLAPNSGYFLAPVLDQRWLQRGANAVPQTCPLVCAGAAA